MPVVVCKADKHVLALLKHLVTADEAAHLPLAVLDETPHLGLSLVVCSEHHHTQVELRALGLLRVPATPILQLALSRLYNSL